MALDEQIDEILEDITNFAQFTTDSDGNIVPLNWKQSPVLADIKQAILQKLQEEYKRGYNDNARDCYCDSTKVIESLRPHKHLMDDGKSHDIRPDLPKGDDK